MTYNVFGGTSFIAQLLLVVYKRSEAVCLCCVLTLVAPIVIVILHGDPDAHLGQPLVSVITP